MAKSVNRPIKRNVNSKQSGRNTAVNRSVVHDGGSFSIRDESRGDVKSLPRDAVLAAGTSDVKSTKNKASRDMQD